MFLLLYCSYVVAKEHFLLAIVMVTISLVGMYVVTSLPPMRF